jgi:signal peptidase I
MFGDNSPRSKDSRLFDYYNRPRWGVDGHRYAVKEKDLIGKALFVFWPHGVPFLNDGQGFTITNHKERSQNGRGAAVRINYPSYRFPFYPNVSRMKKIR